MLINFALLATLGLLSLAGSNRAADTDSREGALKSSNKPLRSIRDVKVHQARAIVRITMNTNL